VTEDDELVVIELAHVEDFHCWRLRESAHRTGRSAQVTRLPAQRL